MNKPRFLRRTLAIATVAALASPAFAADVPSIDPDPDLFDGLKHGPKRAVQQDDDKTKVDDWEGDNLIVYDSKEQGSAQGGQGSAGGNNPGMDQAATGQGNSLGGGIPGGGAGGSGQPTTPGATPMPGGSSSTPAGASSGTPPPGATPGNVAIGDANKKIPASGTQANVGDNSTAPSGQQQTSSGQESEQGDQNKAAASGNQSGRRGGGVEKGDVMPTEL